MQRLNKLDVFGIACVFVSLLWLTFLNWKLGALAGVLAVGVTSVLYSDMIRLSKRLDYLRTRLP